MAPIQNVCPDHVNSDREFGGNGPSIQSILSLASTPDGKGALCDYVFTADETKSNWTKVQLPNGEYLTVQEFIELYQQLHPGQPVYCAPQFCQDFIDFVEGPQVAAVYGGIGTFVQCGLGGEYTVDLSKIEASVRLFFEVDGATLRFRPPHPDRPESDVLIDITVAGQTGPCENNILAISDDCMETDELEAVLEAELSFALGEFLKTELDPARQPNNIFGTIISSVLSVIGGMPVDLVALVVKDHAEGGLLFVTK